MGEGQSYTWELRKERFTWGEKMTIFKNNGKFSFMSSHKNGTFHETKGLKKKKRKKIFFFCAHKTSKFIKFWNVEGIPPVKKFWFKYLK